MKSSNFEGKVARFYKSYVPFLVFILTENLFLKLSSYLVITKSAPQLIILLENIAVKEI